MSRRIWTKPFIKYNLSGDRDKAKSLERKARACVGYLFDQLMPNQKFRSQNWNYPDGSRITAYVWRDVLGERARVEIFSPRLFGDSDSFAEYYMDSGYVNVQTVFNAPQMLVPTDGEISIIYINESVTDVHDSTSRLLQLPRLQPTALVDGSPPPALPYNSSIVNDKEWSFMVRGQKAAMRSSGKLRLFNQAKLGRKIDQYSAEKSSMFYPNAPGTTDGKGLLTIGSQYFLVSIDGDAGTIDITPLSVPDNLLSVVSGGGLSDDQELKIEAYLLAYARKRDDKSARISFDNSELNGFPIYWGWAFNWDGSQAKIITHRATGEAVYFQHIPELAYRENSVETKEITLEITLTDGVFSASTSCITYPPWLFNSKKTVIWQPSPFLSSVCPWLPRSSTGPLGAPITDALPFNTPLYGFYCASEGSYKNFTYTKVEYSTDIRTEDTTTEYKTCANAANPTAYIHGGFVLVDRETRWGVSRTTTVQAGEAIVSTRESENLSSYRVADFVSGSRRTTSALFASNYFNVSDSRCIGPGSFENYIVEVAELPEGFDHGRILQTQHRYNVSYKIVSGQVDVQSDTRNSAVVFSHDNCESVVLVQSSLLRFGSASVSTRQQSNDLPWGTEEGMFSALNIKTNKVEELTDYSGNIYFNTPVPAYSVQLSTSPYFVCSSIMRVVDRYGEVHTIERESSGQLFSDLDTLLHSFTYIRSEDDNGPCWGFPIELMQGIGLSSRLSFGINDINYSFGGLPSELHSAANVCPLGFA